MTSKDDQRQARLAAALRDNLKRRKAQARAGQAEGGADQPAPPPVTPSSERP